MRNNILTGGTAQEEEPISLVAGCRAQQGRKQTAAVSDTDSVRNNHDKTLRASASVFSSSFTPSRPPWILRGLSSTSTLLV